ARRPDRGARRAVDGARARAARPDARRRGPPARRSRRRAADVPRGRAAPEPCARGAGMTTGVLVIGHGSRYPHGNAELEAAVAAYGAARPGLEVAHGYVELAAPALGPALRALGDRADHVVAVPLFLFAAGHVKNDIPLALADARRDCPRVAFTAARALGVHPALVELANERARPALSRSRDPARTAVIVVGRGPSDPDANGDFCKVVRLFGEGRGLGWVVPSFLGVTRPSFEDAAELIVRARPERVVVVPYLLFGGR